jgi:hypothetical protein
VRSSWLLALILLTLFLLPFLSFTPAAVLGMNVGSVRFLGIPLEHEAFGIGMISAALFATEGGTLRWALAGIGLFLVISEIPSGLSDLGRNLPGTLLSLALGFMYSFVFLKAFGGEEEA